MDFMSGLVVRTAVEKIIIVELFELWKEVYFGFVYSLEIVVNCF